MQAEILNIIEKILDHSIDMQNQINQLQDQHLNLLRTVDKLASIVQERG